MPLVSVIMPSCNHERYVSEAIESILNQTFTDFELIITDDSSKDNSKEIIRAYEARDRRIRAFFHSENKGIARTMNDGLEKAKGKFIAFFASDDVWVKDNLRKQLEVLEKNEDLVVWSESLVIDACGKPTGELFTQRCGSSKRKKNGDVFEELLRGNYICGSSVILKRENLKDIRFDEQLKYLNDHKLMVDLARKYNFYFIPEPLAMYRIHGANAVLLDREEGWPKDQIIVCEYFLREYGDDISNKVKSTICLSIGDAYVCLGEREKARAYIYRGVKLNPFDRRNPIHLALALTAKDSRVRNLLRWCYRKYRGIVNQRRNKKGNQLADERRIPRCPS
jgi:glycosyltransferase involved in cell wall biosynthesis